MTREEAARAFAAAMKLEWLRSAEAVCAGETRFYDESSGRAIEFPRADALLSSHLAFVGRVAMALGKPWRLTFGDYTGAALPFQVGFSRADDENHIAWASDPSWAALLAALEAKGVSR